MLAMNQSHPIHKKNELSPGVSGILRCRNHGAYLRLCIDSCIDALDEIVAIYHDSTDDTEDILHEYAERYPNKIKILHYKEYVFPLNLDSAMYEYAVTLPDNSPNLFCGYTNRAMAEASYKWIFRIDADQIYFTERLKRICDSYRSDAVPKDGVVAYYSGINLFLIKGRWHVCAGGERELYPLFNGYGDHFFHPNNEDCFYTKFLGKPLEGKNRLTEYVSIRKPLVSGGFLWFHIPNLFPDAQVIVEGQYALFPDRFIELDKLRQITFASFDETYHPYIPFDFAKDIYKNKFDNAKHHIPWEVLSVIKKQYDKVIFSKKIQMNKSFHLEYTGLLNQAVSCFLSAHKNMMVFNGADMAEAVRILLLRHLAEEEPYYASCRNNGKSPNLSMERVSSCLALFTNNNSHEVPLSYDTHEAWNNLLSDYKGTVIVFADKSSTLSENIARFDGIGGAKILLSLDEMPESAEFPDDCIAIKLENTSILKDSNAYLRKNFPYIHRIANSMSWLLSILKPKAIINLSSLTVAGVILTRLAVASNINIYDR